jgi:hypothetical protein
MTLYEDLRRQYLLGLPPESGPSGIEVLNCQQRMTFTERVQDVLLFVLVAAMVGGTIVVFVVRRWLRLLNAFVQRAFGTWPRG